MMKSRTKDEEGKEEGMKTETEVEEEEEEKTMEEETIWWSHIMSVPSV